MHKIAPFLSFTSTNIQNVLISHYRMYGRFAYGKMVRARAHGAVGLYYVLRFCKYAHMNIPHISPLYKVNICGIVSNYEG